MAAPVSRSIVHCTKHCSLFKRFCSTSQNVSEAAVKPAKEPLRQRIVSHFKRMLDDYKYSATETVKLYKEKPFRMSLYTTLAASAAYFYANNPSMDDYQGHLASMTCDLAEVGNEIRNKEKSNQVLTLVNYNTHGRLRRFTLGVCSFIWVSDYPKYVDLYEAHCKEVQMSWREFPNYIVDIGVLGRWLWSEQYIVDFDINPDEWKDSEQSSNTTQVKH